MSRTFIIDREPYDKGDKIYSKSEFVFEPGVTVLVGCNGAGKTTLLSSIKEVLKREEVPVLSFDNLTDGGHHSIQEAMFVDDFSFVITAAQSSEGENIVMNLGKLASKLRRFIKTGETTNPGKSLARAFQEAMSGKSVDETEVPNERWILLDAIDSGLSVDNVVDIKECLFKTILEDSAEKDVYIVVSANEFEMCRGEACMDVRTGRYMEFKDYEDYRSFILKSRVWKNKRYEKRR